MLTLKCTCINQHHLSKRVVITGGPGAGKTALLEIARKEFCEHILILPEAATILFGGGFPRYDSVNSKKASQKAIYYIQREVESLIEVEKNPALTLCDRGTLDGLAYWPLTENEYWQATGSSEVQELARYSAVIHLRTPALDHGYNNDNPVRIESAQQAALIDKRIEDAWKNHPNRYIIESDIDFLEKVAKSMELLRSELPECCSFISSLKAP